MKKLNYYFGFAIIATLILNLYTGHMTPLLWVTAYASIFNLYLTTKRSKWFIIPDMIWIFGMLYIATNNKLYYDVFQYVYYFIIGIIQFIAWNKYETDGKFEIKRLKSNQIIYTLIGLVPVLIFLTWFGYIIGDASPFLDGLNTSLSFMGAFLLSRRYFEAQYLFLLANLSTAILYLYRGIPSVSITMLLFIGFTLIAINEWRKG